MKILLVAIPNHHFFQWTNQLKETGYEVHWFDITDGAGFSDKISWVKQYPGWKMKWNYPFRQKIKKYLPSFYFTIQKKNERSVTTVFSQLINKIQPDIIHVFEMQLAGHPVFSVLKKNRTIPLVYSSWGSDLFQYERLGLDTSFVQQFLNRVDYLITDCGRDYGKALQLGFKSNFLGIYPGNGGIDYPKESILAVENRTTIMVKGYEDGVGKALVILKSIEKYIPTLFKKYDLLVYSADAVVVNYLQSKPLFNQEKVQIFARKKYIPNAILLDYMGKSALHLANSLSDGMPNALLEAMGMGAFPIQSNPGGVTEEVIQNGQNGFLIQDPKNEQEIANLILQALQDLQLRKKAQEINIVNANYHYDRVFLKSKIVDLYLQISNEWSSRTS
ncbi:glycosyltransferase family 4 protein [Flavobacterium columnare]|uniref:Glycosyltransferase family 4 protein n=1 Tax=Flavobacterium columnare TaxID=996 RepID=A0AAI8CJK4_9FLAO|nr:glycosyltransferase family 4 protein [Flavobacterium columnare]AMO21180.1 glycosyltransferase family 4 protein [Flavobacterium columnare]MEB3802222.1 glycosyltransferase family 4 protein [Flavobacterium columnare]QOG58280.1 glycosyltransferase family 4 protein [Flavobacterium columnare]QOG61003.1 glycosyltransferase family 4 protein [Flavobacterium columnare]QOG63723.1 glycosyltransferase family 4 protein [Flavobacterium columnare]